MNARRPNRFDAETKAWARAVILEIVAGAYFAWDARCEYGRTPEPRLTVAALTDDLDQRARPLDYQCSPRRWRSSMVRSTCESLRRAGELGSSIGCGEHGGEALCYEPVNL